MTTVRELIDHLSKFPPDAHVSIDMFSESAPLDLEKVTLVKADSRKVIFRNGTYMSFRPEWSDKSESNQFVDVVMFPGN